MPTRLIIARHGNTFDAGDTPTRVGRRTDLPLVASGEAQARRIGDYLRRRQMVPAVVFAAPLKRSCETARLAVEALGRDLPITIDDRGSTRSTTAPTRTSPNPPLSPESVIRRCATGTTTPRCRPAGWPTRKPSSMTGWPSGTPADTPFSGQTVLVVTSNGIARFAPHLTGDFEGFRHQHGIKIATGALCFLRLQEGHWLIEKWNVRPT